MNSIEIKKLLEQTPASLAKTQYKELKKAVVNRLRDIANLINSDALDKADDELSISGAGDGYGDVNNYIDFGDILPGIDNEDLGHAIDMLQDLSRHIKAGAKK